MLLSVVCTANRKRRVVADVRKYAQSNSGHILSSARESDGEMIANDDHDLHGNQNPSNWMFLRELIYFKMARADLLHSDW